MRRGLILRAIRAGRPAVAAQLVGRHDPFRETALFRAVDRVVSQRAWHDLAVLAPLARRAHPFAARVWRALSLWYDHNAQAQDAFARLGADMNEHGFNRMGARAWAMFLTLPRMGDNAPDGQNPAVFQFWDHAPPAEISAAMAAWRNAAEDGYAVYDAASAETYIGQVAGAAEARLFNAAPHPAIQSDYFRLCRLMAEGGLYVDADARLRPGMSGVRAALAGRTAIWMRTRAPAMSIANGFLAAPANAPLVVEAFAEASRRLADSTSRHVFEYAGPTLMTETALRLHGAGALGPVLAMTDDEVSSRAMTQIDARYKADNRNWHIWQDNRA